METPASVGKHPIHPMLVAFPIGLWVFSLVCDLIQMARPVEPIWGQVAYYTLAGGIIGALLAAVPGLIDLLSIRNAQTRGVAIKHMVANLIAVAVFVVSFWMRTRSVAQGALPVAISAVGIAVICYSGWLGGELVYRGRVGVQEPTAATAPRERAQPYMGERPEHRPPSRPQ